jgi:hypothetical protein
MVGMTAFIGMRNDATDSLSCHGASERPRHIRDMAGGILIGHADLDERSLGYPGDAHGAAKLPGARCRICTGRVVAARFCIHQVSRRPVCRHHDRGAVGQLGAAADRLVVRVRDNNADRDVAPWWDCG